MDEIAKSLDKFKFYVEGKVQFSEVDSFEVVHNIQYLYWMENSRLEYLDKIGIKIEKNTIREKLPLMVVSTSISYLAPLFFTDKYRVYCRTASIGNSSLTMENVVTNENNEICAIARSVMVHLEKGTFKSKRIPDEVREKIKQFEQTNLEITG